MKNTKNTVELKETELEKVSGGRLPFYKDLTGDNEMWPAPL